jgi:hypothetical protein
VGLRAALLYNFYVYQYATSMVASTSLARAVREELKTGKTARRDAYLRMLSSGSSKYAIDLLKDAGVDMTTSAPFDAAIAEMNGTMDEMEQNRSSTASPSPRSAERHRRECEDGTRTPYRAKPDRSFGVRPPGRCQAPPSGHFQPSAADNPVPNRSHGGRSGRTPERAERKTPRNPGSTKCEEGDSNPYFLRNQILRLAGSGGFLRKNNRLHGNGGGELVPAPSITPRFRGVVVGLACGA